MSASHEKNSFQTNKKNILLGKQHIVGGLEVIVKRATIYFKTPITNTSLTTHLKKRIPLKTLTKKSVKILKKNIPHESKQTPNFP